MRVLDDGYIALERGRKPLMAPHLTTPPSALINEVGCKAACTPYSVQVLRSLGGDIHVRRTRLWLAIAITWILVIITLAGYFYHPEETPNVMLEALV
jgi:hypothetical protein